MSVTLVHYFHTQVGTVDYVSPSANYTTLRVNDGLVEVETVQVERHRGNSQGSHPDSDNRPSAKQEVKLTAVVEGSVLEDQTTEVAVGCNDVVSFFFLTEFVAVVLGLNFSRFTDQGRSNQRTVHSGEQATTEDTSNSQHVERVHQDIVLSLEHQHEVECTGDTQRHTVRERTLSDRVDQEHGSCSCNRCRVSNTDPRTHTEAVGKFPLTTHVAEHSDQEVEHYQLVRTTVVKPLIQGSSFPDWIEVKTDSVRGRNNSTSDDVVSVHQGTSNWFADAVDVNGRSCYESDQVANGCRKQGWDHQNAKPAYIEAVVG